MQILILCADEEVSTRVRALPKIRKGGNDTDKLELHLIDNAAAELHFFLNDEDLRDITESGVPPPKPIRLTKAG